MLRKLIPVLAAIALVTATGCSDGTDYSNEFELPEETEKNNKVTLKFGRVPSVTVTELLRQNAPLIRLLKDELDVNITYRFADNYRGIINGMTSETYDFTWLGPYSYVLSDCASTTSASYKPLVRPVRRSDNGELSSEYRGLIFARKDAGISNLSDLKGSSLAFVDKRSTSGYLFPMATLIENGLKPNVDFSYEFLKRHDQVVGAVLNNEFRAGAIYDDARMEQFDSKNQAESNLPVIAKTKPIPSSPIAVSRAFARKHPDLVEKFVDVMTSLHTSPRGTKILGNLSISRYREANDSDYDEVRNVLEEIGSELPDVKSLCRNGSSA